MSDRLIARRVFRPRRPALPEARTCSQAEAIEILRRQLFEDACAAGWLKPCSRKTNTIRDGLIYSVEAVKDVEDRVLAGEYPKGGES